jgi:hypothetical protein
MCSPTPLLFFGKALVNLDNNESAMDAAAAEHHHAGTPVRHLQQRIVGRVLIKVSERRVVEARPIEQVGAGSGEHGGQPEVHELCGLLADDVHAQERRSPRQRGCWRRVQVAE